jgi:hypothetical protein
MLGSLTTTRYPARGWVLFLLSIKAGLRAKEMASLRVCSRQYWPRGGPSPLHCRAHRRPRGELL